MRLGEIHNVKKIKIKRTSAPLHSCQLLIFGSGERCKLISSVWGRAPEAKHNFEGN